MYISVDESQMSVFFWIVFVFCLDGTEYKCSSKYAGCGCV